MIKDKIIKLFFGDDPDGTIFSKGFLELIEKQTLERTPIPGGHIYRLNNKDWHDAIVVIGDCWDDITSFMEHGGTASFCDSNYNEHLYDPVTCKRCGQKFCIGCAASTNVHLSDTVRTEEKFMLCPMCMQDHFKEVKNNEW